MSRPATLRVGEPVEEGIPNALDATGPAAAEIAVLWWVMLGLGAAVMVLVTAFLLIAARRPLPARTPRWLIGGGTPFVTFWGIAVTGAIILVVLGFTVRTGALTYDPQTDPDEPMEIHVVGHKFWWEVRYDEADVVTANEIHIPTGEPVRLRLDSEDVIHSFWVPQLHGKMDMIPGHANEFWFQADEPGTYRGICAEFCGVQHAQMHYLVVASEPEEFEDWLAAEAEPAPDVDEAEDAEAVARGQEVYEAANCVACHDVQGQFETGTRRGPDLTHFASRQTIAAGMQPNDRDHLRDWILDPQATKPGVRMPATPLGDDDLEALLDYLETLE